MIKTKYCLVFDCDKASLVNPSGITLIEDVNNIIHLKDNLDIFIKELNKQREEIIILKKEVERQELINNSLKTDKEVDKSFTDMKDLSNKVFSLESNNYNAKQHAIEFIDDIKKGYLGVYDKGNLIKHLEKIVFYLEGRV